MSSTIFGGLSALADPLRGRILLALEKYELAVSELCAVFQLPQSTMSRHLKLLADQGWAVSRAEGPSRRYSMPAGSLDPVLRGVWVAVREQVAAMPAAQADAERIATVVSERRSRSREFFAASGGEWDRLRRELIGRRLDVVAMLALLDESWAVGDLGCGTGLVSEMLAPFVSRVYAVDESATMLEVARSRLEGLPNVEVRHGELERLPLKDDSLDAAVICLVLQYVAEPAAVVQEAARVLRPGGRLLIADLAEHEREEYRQRLGHQWLGFSAGQVFDWMTDAGLTALRHVSLPADPEAKGPRMFVASGRVP